MKQSCKSIDFVERLSGMVGLHVPPVLANDEARMTKDEGMTKLE